MTEWQSPPRAEHTESAARSPLTTVSQRSHSASQSIHHQSLSWAGHRGRGWRYRNAGGVPSLALAELTVSCRRQVMAIVRSYEHQPS